eukprot:s2_g22.t1
MIAEPTGTSFSFRGLLDGGHSSYALLDATLLKQFPQPHLVATARTRILHHDPPTWHSLHELIDLCSGFGGLSQGAHASGFFVKVAVDQNSKMLSLFQSQFNCDVVWGDIGDTSVIFDTWSASKGASSMGAGFSCQPFSNLGDGLGMHDARATCLSKVLKMAYYLKVAFLTLECVAPAAQNEFVQSEIQHFQNVTGFNCSQCELKLQDVWSSRRPRAWWVLSHPMFGVLDLQPWPSMSTVSRVEHVIPSICHWDPNDERALILSDIEAEAFGLHDGSYTKYLLDARGQAPCALHSWGNQVTACPCGCRAFGLSKHRLETKGLFGLLVRSAPDAQGQTFVRHVHPNESMALNAFDPMLDFGPDVRLTLCAVGQLASPLQSAWVFGTIAAQIDRSQFGQILFSPLAQVQAFRSWLLMRCRQVWSPEVEPIQDANLLSLMSFWNDFRDLSLPELLYLPQWDQLTGCSLSIAAVLDAIIRDAPSAPSAMPAPTVSAPASGPVAASDEPETPCLPVAPAEQFCEFTGCPLSCRVFILDESLVPVSFMVSPGSTVGQFLSAHASLCEHLGPVLISTPDGAVLDDSHVLHVGQVLLVRKLSQSYMEVSHAHDVGQMSFPVGPANALPVSHAPEVHDVHMSVGLPDECQPTCIESSVPSPKLSGLDVGYVRHAAWERRPLPRMPEVCPLSSQRECGPLPKLPSEPASQADFHGKRASTEALSGECGLLPRMPLMPVSQASASAGGLALGVDDGEVLAVAPNDGFDLSPTAPMPGAALPVQPCPSRTLSNLFDVGECIPTAEGDAQSLLSATPLLALHDAQLVALSAPCLDCPKHLWSLRHQFIVSADRLAILSNQGDTWADDELRFHMVQLLQRFETGVMTKTKDLQRPLMLDPLVSGSWERNDGLFCLQWCGVHPEILQQGVPVIACFKNKDHWLPAVFLPTKDSLQILTWDVVGADHAGLHDLFNKMGVAMGFSKVLVNCHHRLFFTSHLCGALAISFLHYALLDTMLPTSHSEAEVLHRRMRQAFVAELTPCPITARPWIWGNGDTEEHFDFESVLSSADSAPSQWSPAAATAASLTPSSIDLEAYEIDVPRAGFGFGGHGGRAHFCISAEERIQLILEHGTAMADDEIRFHAIELLQDHSVQSVEPSESQAGFAFLEPMIFSTWETVGRDMCIRWCQNNFHIRLLDHQIISAIHHDNHWMPFWATIHENTLQVTIANDVHGGIPHQDDMCQLLADHLELSEVVVRWVAFGRLPPHDRCGALAVAFLHHIVAGASLPEDLTELKDLHTELRSAFVAGVYNSTCCRCPCIWGQGQGNLARELATELLKHGVPETEVDARASQAIRAIGSEQIHQALQQRNPWRQLKSLANNVRFQLLHPSELASVVAANRNKPVGKKQKPSATAKVPKMPASVDLDPHKLKILDGIFRADQQVVPQILAQQIGPVSSGVVLMTHQEAEPYLRAGTQVSQEPLALVVFQTPDALIQTPLPHKAVTVPCRCLLDNEPVLVEAVLVQLGRGFVDKVAGQSKVNIEALDVITIKMTTFRDELSIDWETFASAPIRHLVSQFPMLKRCETPDCQCTHWHNLDDLPVKEPILDVWRRQFMRTGFKPAPASKAEFFAVCLRLPKVLMSSLLEASGTGGTYCEPRSADGRDILQEFSVIWTPKQFPIAQAVHAVLRCDAMFLPQGPRHEFLAGPFPYGVDRHAVFRALKQSGWITKPIQPAAPVPGRGTMWMIHSVDEPAETIIMTSHGEVVVSRNKTDSGSRPAVAHQVGSAATLSLCGSSVSKTDDPWMKTPDQDPWGHYRPTHKPSPAPASCPPTESMQQLEARIEQAVLSKLGTSMEDDVPERMTALENQVQGLLSKQQTLETQFVDYSNSNTQQLNLMQSQIHSQSQQLHGQLESQNQSIQAMFQDQMSQIRGLLAKRPREEGAME